MHIKRRFCVLLSWVLIAALTAGMSGCSNKKKTPDSDVSSQETSKEPSSSLQGRNEDTGSNLGPWGRAMGSVLIAINEGSPYYFGGYAVSDANRESAANILKDSWGITSRRTLLRQIKELLDTGSRMDYRREAKEMNALSEKQLKEAMKQLTGNLYVHYQLVQRNWENWGNRGLVAWDMCRISHLVQWGYIAGYLDDREAQAMIEPAAKKLKTQFDNWDDVIMNWLDGYALAATIELEQPGNDYEKRKAVYQSLIDGQQEKGILYDDSMFQAELIPLSDTSYRSILGEVKKKSASGDKKKEDKEKQQETEREDKEE